MNNIVVVYKSKYGTTKRYAEWIAQELDAVLLEASTVKPSQLASFDTVIFGGGLYAGGIAGVELVAKNPCKLLVVFTVGLADPDTADYSAILEKNFTPELLSRTKIFHLRGGIDYKKLGLVHKGMMAMLKNMLRKKDAPELSDENREFLTAYGKQVDFTDKNAIEPIVSFVKGKAES